MKHLLVVLVLANLHGTIHCQEISREVKWSILSQFDAQWLYFRMLKNPLLSYEETHDGANWKNPSRLLLPNQLIGRDYFPDVKISRWGEPATGGNKYIRMNMPDLYLVKKGDNMLYVEKNFRNDSIKNSLRVNVYDSIFPYDNCFLVCYDGWGNYTFQGGNVRWGEWQDVGFIKRVDYVGYARGVQFGIENVLPYNPEFSNKIKNFRPEFPNYVYTCNRLNSLLTKCCVIIGAPEGKEDQLIEYIYYTNIPEKTGDTDENHYYEMRYILPTQIKSIKERHLEKRRLTDEEQKYILERENGMGFFIERKRKIEPEEEIIIETTDDVKNENTDI
jgi:hypothetical protein